MQLKVLCDTTLKLESKQGSLLSEDQKQPINAGKVLEVASFDPTADHIKVCFKGTTFKGKNTWYVFQKHAVMLNGDQVLFPSALKLAVPYFDQLDNSDNPYGSCNVTSAAMSLSYLGARRQHPDQRFADELYEYCDAKGLDRHSPGDLAQVIEAYGCHDLFTTNCDFQHLKEWLIQGNPAIVHGYFTASGHVIAIIGFNEKGFVVNDPYGELSGGSMVYDTYTSGAGLTYSYDLIKKTCCSDGEFWLHRVSK